MTVTAEQAIRRGVDFWAQWQQENPGGSQFAKPNWYDCPDPSGAQIKGHNRINFDGYTLKNAAIYDAFAEGIGIRDAIIDGCRFEEGDFSRADFSNTCFVGTHFNKTILTDSCFDGASFINCNLNRVNLTGARFCLKEITETVVYGISAWDLRTCEAMQQSKLVIERTYDLYSDLVERGQIPVTVDNIELAQFIHYLSDHKKMRDTINILNARGVLLLGRFRDGGLDRLYRIRDWLLTKNYTPMIFDFGRPDSLDLTETVVTMAGLSRLVLADLSGGSVPQELHAILGAFEKPVIAFSEQDPYALLKDLMRKNPYVFFVKFASDAELLNGLAKKLADAEQGHKQLVLRLAELYDQSENRASR
ncbi:MAG: pentapeptide repeat-containing protein [Kineosporiaceae bacterium]